MPSLDEVLAAFPGKWLLIDIKSNDPADGDDAATYRRLPSGYTGGIWTDRIDRIAPLARAQGPYLPSLTLAR